MEILARILVFLEFRDEFNYFWYFLHDLDLFLIFIS